MLTVYFHYKEELIMSVWDWVIIIAKILELIAGGMSKSQAVASVASMFNVSESEIWKHGGF